jgi:hypothetical protein
LPVASFCRRCTNSAYFFARDSRHRKKAIPRASPYQVGLWKTQSCQARQPFRCRVEGTGDAVLGDEGKAVGMQSADGFAVCACHARLPLPAALVCRRTRRLLCRRIKWRAPYMIDEPTHQRPRRDDCGSPMINLTYEDREELIIAAVTGVVIGFVGGYYLDHIRGVRHTLSGHSFARSSLAGWFIVCGPFVSAHALPSSLPAALVRRT